ncbi:MAG: hypothetical protein P8Q26_13740, partial [Ascidiaceihabitans sp.]|nr:hypothetical protein [Ascidiaceihabitans sp.]
NDPIVLWATAHLRQKPSFRWTKGQSCTNFQFGPLKWGCSNLIDHAELQDQFFDQVLDGLQL